MILRDCVTTAKNLLSNSISNLAQDSIDLCFKALECLVIKDDSCTERLKPFVPSEYYSLLKDSTDCALNGIKNYCEKALAFPFFTENDSDSLYNSIEDLQYTTSTNLTDINSNDSNSNDWLEIIGASSNVALPIMAIGGAMLVIITPLSLCYLWNKNKKIKAEKSSLQKDKEILKKHEDNVYREKLELHEEKHKLNVEKTLLAEKFFKENKFIPQTGSKNIHDCALSNDKQLFFANPYYDELDLGSPRLFRNAGGPYLDLQGKTSHKHNRDAASKVKGLELIAVDSARKGVVYSPNLECKSPCLTSPSSQARVTSYTLSLFNLHNKTVDNDSVPLLKNQPLDEVDGVYIGPDNLDAEGRLRPDVLHVYAEINDRPNGFKGKCSFDAEGYLCPDAHLRPQHDNLDAEGYLCPDAHLRPQHDNLDAEGYLCPDAHLPV